MTPDEQYPLTPQPPWIPGPSWWARLAASVALVSAVIILDPVRAARICADVLTEFRKDGDR